MSEQESETTRLQAPLGQLERTLIEQFVRERGVDPSRIGELPRADREQLLTQASVYASARMAEVESRSHYLDEIHDSGLGQTGRE